MYLLVIVAEPDEKTETVTRYFMPADRVVERGRGCWNCVSFDMNGDATKKAWSADKQVLQTEFFNIAFAQEVPADYLSLGNQWADNPNAIHVELTDEPHVVRGKMIIKSIDRMDRAIASAAFRLCMCNGASDRGGKYISARYLCDKWNGRVGSSLATSGHALDVLPDELREDKK